MITFNILLLFLHSWLPVLQNLPILYSRQSSTNTCITMIWPWFAMKAATYGKMTSLASVHLIVYWLNLDPAVQHWFVDWISSNTSGRGQLYRYLWYEQQIAMNGWLPWLWEGLWGGGVTSLQQNVIRIKWGASQLKNGDTIGSGGFIRQFEY